MNIHPTRLLISGAAPALPPTVASTRYLERAQLAFTLAVRQKAMLLLDGPPGTGKSTTAAACVAQAAGAGVPTAYLAIPERPSPTDLLRLIIEALAGVPGVGSKHEMENEVRALLSAFGGVLVVDEVQNLQRSGLQELRYLHDDGQTNVTFLLVGWQAEAVIRAHPDLDSRIRYRVPFQPINRADVPGIVRQLHPVVAEADEHLLWAVDDRYGHGILRQWSSFIACAESLLGNNPLTLEDADALLGILDSRSLTGAVA